MDRAEQAAILRISERAHYAVRDHHTRIVNGLWARSGKPCWQDVKARPRLMARIELHERFAAEAELAGYRAGMDAALIEGALNRRDGLVEVLRFTALGRAF